MNTEAITKTLFKTVFTAADTTQAGVMKSLPVVVLLAMSPLNANAKTLNYTEPKEFPTELVMLADTTNSDIIRKIRPTWFKLRFGEIKFCTPVKGDGADYDMIYFTPSEVEHRDWIYNVYLVERGKSYPKNLNGHPPLVTSLVYHNTGDGKEFCGAYVVETVYNDEFKQIGTRIREIVLNDDAANQIIDLITGTAKWGNATGIGFKEVNTADIPETKLFITSK